MCIDRIDSEAQKGCRNGMEGVIDWCEKGGKITNTSDLFGPFMAYQSWWSNEIRDYAQREITYILDTGEESVSQLEAGKLWKCI